MIETIDPEGFEQIRQRYAIEGPTVDWPKYLDLERWIDVNIRRIRRLEIDLMRPKRILDLAAAQDISFTSLNCSDTKGSGSIWMSSPCLATLPGCSACAV